MKGFIDELKKSTQHLEFGGECDTFVKHKELQFKYEALIGKRALYKSGRGEGRVVIIEQATDVFVRVSYKYYGKNYSGKISTCCMYNSLLCGDDRLEME